MVRTDLGEHISTMLHPAASAPPIFHAARFSGKLNAVSPSTTPMGSLVSSVAVPSPAAVVGSVWSGPAARPAAASANQRKLRTGKGTCMKEATARGVPISSTMRSMS